MACRRAALFGFLVLAGLPDLLPGQDVPEPAWYRDRGRGIASSLAALDVEKGRLLVHPFFEYVRDHNREYTPQDFGVGPDINYRAQSRRKAAEIYLGYGVTDWLALEFEGAYVHETFRKAPEDSFATPARLTEKGVADLEAQVRIRALRERPGRPEILTFFELTARTHPENFLIGDPDWDIRPGVALSKGFGFGSLTGRVNAEYNHAEKHFDLGEVAVGYQRGLTAKWRLYLGIEGGEGGSMDEWELLPALRWAPLPGLQLRLESSIGISSKAPDWSPQVGVVFAFP
jgi:hypothetical protein